MADVVSNTSPISYLHRLDRFELLRDLFRTVLLPDAVEQELTRGRAVGFDLPDPRLVPWLEIRPAPPASFEDLGVGETAALSLAVSLPGALVLLDDLPARKRAAALGLTFTGTVGLLIKAKSEGLLTLVAPELERLQSSGSGCLQRFGRQLSSRAGRVDAALPNQMRSRRRGCGRTRAQLAMNLIQTFHESSAHERQRIAPPPGYRFL